MSFIIGVIGLILFIGLIKEWIKEDLKNDSENERKLREEAWRNLDPESFKKVFPEG